MHDASTTLLVAWPVLIPIFTAALTAALWAWPTAQRVVGTASLVLLLGVSLWLAVVVA
jgi:multicomponent Na+:H+ antiporter subunit D